MNVFNYYIIILIITLFLLKYGETGCRLVMFELFEFDIRFESPIRIRFDSKIFSFESASNKYLGIHLGII